MSHPEHLIAQPVHHRGLRGQVVLLLHRGFHSLFAQVAIDAAALIARSSSISCRPGGGNPRAYHASRPGDQIVSSSQNSRPRFLVKSGSGASRRARCGRRSPAGSPRHALADAEERRQAVAVDLAEHLLNDRRPVRGSPAAPAPVEQRLTLAPRGQDTRQMQQRARPRCGRERRTPGGSIRGKPPGGW